MGEFANRENADQIELGTELALDYNEFGLVPAIVTDVRTKKVLMFAWMNEVALKQTMMSKKATFYSRSREKIWVKGESSGRVMHVQDLLVDCDQDVIQLVVEVEGEGVCHRGYRSCFYRKVSDFKTGKLEYVEEAPVFDPDDVYGE